jgi:hypothetical protein
MALCLLCFQSNALLIGEGRDFLEWFTSGVCPEGYQVGREMKFPQCAAVGAQNWQNCDFFPGKCCSVQAQQVTGHFGQA